MPTLEDALSYAAQGWRVLPLRGKIPLTRHGVKDASCDPAQVRQWWAHGAQHNLGAQVPGHLVVLDFDPRNGGTVEALEQLLRAPLPDTLTAHSGRGDGGQHRYYLHPGGQLSSRRLPPGIDVKTASGYCVIPPSLHPDTGKPYIWASRAAPGRLPAQLVEILHPPRPQVPAQVTLPARGNRAGSLAMKAGYLAEHVAAAGEGQRNARLFWAACQAHRDGHPSETFTLLEQAGARTGLTAEEIARTLASAHRTVRTTP
ncbi:bifunctional DNA primase/polymerase [Leucobacter sp. W1038]|uniref:bifunctional DNA primase/polymerase n=1 Tax=Leucobacter sp. W1038 TaxID=3438281 RepID=UPI003D997ACF